MLEFGQRQSLENSSHAHKAGDIPNRSLEEGTQSARGAMERMGAKGKRTGAEGDDTTKMFVSKHDNHNQPTGYCHEQKGNSGTFHKTNTQVTDSSKGLREEGFNLDLKTNTTDPISQETETISRGADNARKRFRAKILDISSSSGPDDSPLRSAMITLCWNCRGLGNPQTVQVLRRRCRSYLSDIVFLNEIMCDKREVENLRIKLDFANAIGVSSEGNSGGLGILWRDGVRFQLESFF